ncbi:MAG: GNAT family N-acetyltransferase [Halopenitus sp.]
MPGPVFLRGETVDLHAINEDDLDFLARGRNDPAIRHWMSRTEPQSPATDRASLERFLSTGGHDAAFIVCVDGDPVGFVSLFDVAPDAGRGELAAWFLPAEQGEGYGTEAVSMVVEYAFDERRLHRLYGGARADNDASRAIVETLGFVEEGRQRDHYYVAGEHVDRVFYGLLQEEWEEIQAPK